MEKSKVLIYKLLLVSVISYYHIIIKQIKIIKKYK